MAKIAVAAATSQIALIGSPRLNATTPRQNAPTIAMATQTILLAALGGGTVACIGCMAASPRQYRKVPPGNGGGQCLGWRAALAIGRMAFGPVGTGAGLALPSHRPQTMRNGRTTRPA